MAHTGATYGHIKLLGSQQRIQVECVHLSLPGHPEYEWETDVAFIMDPEFQMPFQGILGSKGFLDRYAVTLDFYNNRFVVERPADWEDRVGRHLEFNPAEQDDPQWHRPT